MPVQDIVKNHDLLAKVMSHYRHLLEHVHEGEAAMSNAMKENLSFRDTIKEVEQVLSIQGGKATEEAKKHAELLTIAVSQYTKDLETVVEKTKKLIPDAAEGDLHRLESELKTLKAYLTK